MNGRVYDPATAQFFSPDPFVQEAGNWQNYNRYSYVYNNPLIFTDPSGYRKKTFHELEMEYLSDYTPVRNTSYRYIKETSTSGGGNLYQSYIEVLSNGYSGDYSDYIYSFERQSNKSGFNGYIRIPASTFNHGGFTPDYTTVWDHKFIEIWVGNRPMDNAAGGGVDGKDLIGIVFGAVGSFFDVKGNASHNDLYWKGKTTSKFYFKNPFTKKINVGWKANSFKATGKAFQGAKSLGTKLGVAGLLITGTDILFGDGLTTSNALDAAFGIAGFVPGIGWAISSTYFVVNTGVLLYTGKSIGENIDE